MPVHTVESIVSLAIHDHIMALNALIRSFWVSSLCCRQTTPTWIALPMLMQPRKFALIWMVCNISVSLSWPPSKQGHQHTRRKSDGLSVEARRKIIEIFHPFTMSSTSHLIHDQLLLLLFCIVPSSFNRRRTASYQRAVTVFKPWKYIYVTLQFL